MQNLEKFCETALAKISKAHDLIGRISPSKDKENPQCRVAALLALISSPEMSFKGF